MALLSHLRILVALLISPALTVLLFLFAFAIVCLLWLVMKELVSHGVPSDEFLREAVEGVLIVMMLFVTYSAGFLLFVPVYTLFFVVIAYWASRSEDWSFALGIESSAYATVPTAVCMLVFVSLETGFFWALAFVAIFGISIATPAVACGVTFWVVGLWRSPLSLRGIG